MEKTRTVTGERRLLPQDSDVDSGDDIKEAEVKVSIWPFSDISHHAYNILVAKPLYHSREKNLM